MYDLDRQTGRTTRLIEKAKAEGAYFAVPNLAMQRYCEYKWPEMRTRVFVPTRHWLDNERGTTGRKFVLDHTMASHAPELIENIKQYCRFQNGEIIE